MHWAANLIGRPWTPMGEGPDSFSCWGFVRYVFRTRHGIEMPPVRIDDEHEGNVGAIKRASEASGWRLAQPPAQADDILLLYGHHGRRHVGLMVDLDGTLVVLHANGYLKPNGKAVGCIERQSLEDILADGYRYPEFWRRA